MKWHITSSVAVSPAVWRTERENPIMTKKTLLSLLACLCLLPALLLAGCGSAGGSGSGSGGATVLGSGSKKLRIVSGSENKELEPILSDYANQNHLSIEMTYMGSLDIMRALEQDDFPYDAVWPASSIWLNAGDENLHRVKHAESISITPVVFGIKKSKAESLGFVGKDVMVSDILEKISGGELKFCMTSATQSNSGASAYIGFLYALSGHPDVLTSADLDDRTMQENMRGLLSGVDRSSGSSDWLKDMFLAGDYDAMVNYECLMISANNELVKEGKEPLYIVYPSDGLALADSPLGYIDHGDSDTEQRFLDFQNYLLSAECQSKIQRTGRRSGYTGINPENKDVFNTDWGCQPDRVLSTFKMPDTATLAKALTLYQTALRKPSLSIYCIDYSGSMSGEGNERLVEAMQQLLIQENAQKNYLQASPDDVNILIAFSDWIQDEFRAEGNGKELDALFEDVQNEGIGGGTNMYLALDQALSDLSEYDLSRYTAAIILMTDGVSADYYDDFKKAYEQSGCTVPVFSILYGDADDSQLQQLAQLTNGRVFDGRKDLTGAFRKVKGYN